ncbi:MAG: hypothetical protein IKH94_07400 [Eubacterium sp.]|nr:hypothetical protein [Eubacterium sp.]
MRNKHSKRNNIFRVLVMAIVILITGITGQYFGSYAMTPRVMMTSYSLDKKEIYPGDTFSLKFTIKNTSKNMIMNLKCTAVSAKGEFLPINGVGTDYVDEIAGEEEQEIILDFEAVKGLSEKTYNIKIKTEYEDWSGSYKSEDTVYIPIKLKTEVLVSDTYIAEEEIRLGDNIEIVSTINNIGAADIYKVTAQLSGHNIDDATSYIGNIKSGKNANVDIITKATKHDDPLDATQYDNDLIITYEDINGNKYSEKVGMGNITVLEQDFSDIIQIKEDTTKHLTEANKAEIIIAVTLVLVGIFFVRRTIKRKKLEKNFN